MIIKIHKSTYIYNKHTHTFIHTTHVQFIVLDVRYIVIDVAYLSFQNCPVNCPQTDESWKNKFERNLQLWRDSEKAVRKMKLLQKIKAVSDQLADMAKPKVNTEIQLKQVQWFSAHKIATSYHVFRLPCYFSRYY